MPHKHTRRDHDPSAFDLPPSQIAKPLPVNRSRKHEDASAKTSSATGPKKRKARRDPDDAPRAFKRLMSFAQGKKPRSGLDDGSTPSKKRAKATPSTAGPTGSTNPQMPTIRPGEKLSDFAARVDAALPLSGLVTKTVKDGKDPLGLKVRRTKKERKMHKLYEQWREEDKRIKEKREEALEEEAERQLDQDLANGTLTTEWPTHYDDATEEGGKKKKKKKKGKANAPDEEDLWEQLQRKAKEAKPSLHDVAKAPPTLPKNIRAVFKVRGAAVDVENVPKASGSLRRREELQTIRTEVVESYRKARDEKRARTVL
ncbi:hypothetical protein SODALDRAFT_330608 [Sodiomyces alkalinus F11]|uniref:Urease accessory protein UreD n=1 Tax=Sodiomyces alkalinus (strain CBS 110278 / VKM F-3762 / F11) TaxID=1314773 RepID=A0A3N2Q291_SODAK|nr:hypothetical protein SODALDRAFT_330608 [Sodiomyces alkalinus F11]ROT40883.1 hypothetical protein SODALDRAFT_330608 [Sodiomyces alkalinus F11]